jgi:hypothetical protein
MVFCCSVVAQSQSTDRLGPTEGPWQLEIGAGIASGLSSSNPRPASLVAGLVDVRYPFDGGITGIRGTVWALHWSGGNGRRYVYYSYTTGGSYTTYSSTLMSADAVVATLDLDSPIRLAGGVVVAPIAGAGVIPYSRYTFTRSGGGPPTIDAPSSPPGGLMLSAGVEVRWRHVVVSQRLLVPAHTVGSSTLCTPIAASWRF